MTPPDPDLEPLYHRYFPMIRAKCQRMLGEEAEAEDVAQETFVRLWNSDLPRDPKIVVAWIYRTSTRMVVDRLRHRAVVSRFADETRAESPHPVGALEARQALAALARTTDERTLQAVILHRIDGLSHLQVGDVLGVSERSVRRLLSAFDADAEVAR